MSSLELIDRARLIHEVANSLTQGCHEDYVGLWLLVGAFEMRHPEHHFTDSEIREMALEVIREMLGKADIRAGMYDDKGFVPWDLSIEEVIARVEREWIELGVRSPNPFLIVTLVAWP